MGAIGPGPAPMTIEDVARAAGVSKGAVSRLLTTDDETISGLAQLASIEPTNFDVVLPEPDDAVSDLLRLGVRHEDVDAIVACLPVLGQPGPLRWLLIHRGLSAAVDPVDGEPRQAGFPVEGSRRRGA